MRFAAVFSLGPGRSSVERGVVALIAAPILMTFPLALLIHLSDLHGGSVLFHPISAIRGITGLATALLKLTLIFGIPTWAFLRLFHRESGRAYVLAGLGWGVLGAIWVSYAFRNAWSADQVPNAVFVGVLGGCIAATFWSIARDPAINQGDQS